MHSGIYAGATSEYRSEYVDNEVVRTAEKKPFEITYGDYHFYPYRDDTRCNYSSLHKQPGVVTNLSPSIYMAYTYNENQYLQHELVRRSQVRI